jgi:hypothetical protein
MMRQTRGEDDYFGQHGVANGGLGGAGSGLRCEGAGDAGTIGCDTKD